MTPAEHYAVAERSLAMLTYSDAVGAHPSTASVIQYSIAHFLAAIAGELGVPVTGGATTTPAPSGAGTASSSSTG